mmetsp:Transcript_5248/g.15193  ORF Transcript_5248/g.15193 Transcript_5248/m.15193 type:complete len:222 (-) Transcript_5248:79-744(-)
MLVVTTTVGMLYRVLCHTTNLGPAIALHGILVVSTTSLEKRLVGTAATSDNTNLGTNTRPHSLLATRGQTEASGALLLIVRDDDSKAARSTREGTTISLLGLNVAHNGSLGDNRKGKDVPDDELGLLTAVHKHACVHALGGDHELRIPLVTVRIAELDLGNRGTTPRVMDDLLDDAANVTLTLGVVERTELHGTLAGARMRLEHGRLALSLGLDVLSHLDG